MLTQGETVTYRPGKGTTTMKALIVSSHCIGDMVEVIIASDPFPSWVRYDQLTASNKGREHVKMPTATKSAKTLRSEARRLGIEGWEDMDRDELEQAIAEAAEEEDVEDEDTDDEDDEDEAPRRPAKKASKSAKKAPAKKAHTAKKSAPSKKAPASKKAAPKRAAADDEATGPNPFREGSNLWHFTEALMRGGKRSAMVTKLERKVDLKPRVRGGRDYDVAAEIDYRLVRVCQLLQNEHGFIIEKEGRGTEQRVKAISPEDQ